MPTNAELDKYYEALMASGKYPSSLYGLYYRETGNAKNKATAGAGTRYYGPMQLGEDAAKTMGIDRFDPYQNIQGGLGYAQKLQQDFDDPLKGIAAFNWGPTRLRRHIREHGDEWFTKLPTPVRNYVLKTHGWDPQFERTIPPGMLEMETWGSRGSSAAGQPPEAFLESLSTLKNPRD